MKNNKNYKIYTKDKIFLNLMSIMFLGSLFGSLALGILSDDSVYKINLFLDKFINSKDLNDTYFFEVFLKSIKYYIFIWFLGFIYYGHIYIYIIIFYKTFLISFTTSLFFYNYGINSIKYISDSYMIQNIIHILIILVLAYKSIMYCKNKMQKKTNNFFVYLKIFIVTIILNVLVLIIYKYFT